MFDLRFTVLRPGAADNDDVILVDLEVQNDVTDDLVKRVVYYCSRMLDAQRNTRFKGNQYGFSHTKEENNMVNITKMLINIERDLAIEEGRAKGKAEGRAEDSQKWILGLLKRGMTKEEVMEIGKISRNELEAIISG